MISNDGLAPFSGSTANQTAAIIGADTEFEARWAAWVARGRVHEQLVRRQVVVWASVLATAVAIAAFMRA